MTDWLSKLEQLDIPDGAVAGLSNADKSIIEGKMLQLPAGDRPLFFRGQQIDVLKRLRTLLPDTPAASGPGRLTYDELYSKLSQTKGHVDSKVLSHMIRFFAAEILLANQDILSDLYDSAKASPLSSTKASLREDEGLIFNGAFVAGTPSRAVLLIAFENGAMPVLCKFTAEQQAVVHEFEVLELLWQEPAVPRIVGPVKLLKANPAGRSHGHVAAPGGPAPRVKQCLQMPVYPATLQHIPAPMKEPVILTFGRQLKTSLQHVHQKGYGHNDVKAANIFISAAGECILGDFGSALELEYGIDHFHKRTLAASSVGIVSVKTQRL
ncbi:hypothetical protein WJX77_012718 [Trebouxia sp. C0004]